MILSLVAFVLQLPPIQPFAQNLREAVSLGDRDRVVQFFDKRADSDYLFRMAGDRGGLRSLKVAIIPAPPGWEATGNYWAVIHTRQDIEDHHDPVYPVVVSGFDWKLGHEIPVDATTGVAVRNAAMDVHVVPASSRVDVHTVLDLDVSASNRAPLFRLNDDYHIEAANTLGKPSTAIEVNELIPTPKPGDLVHAGGLLIPWSKSISPQATFDYFGNITSKDEDKIDANVCYITAMWVPTLGQLPFTTSTRIVGPESWVLESEGNPTTSTTTLVKAKFHAGAGEQVRSFHCDVPISFPKVIGGNYILSASKTVDGRTYRAYHLDSNDDERARIDVATMVDAISWYEAHLGPFPFNEYNCFDADTYYGIESYNYTLLRRDITKWAVSHEAGHTYFGGLVPCAYVHDSWNESMTQYVDSVLHYNNADQTLDNAYRSIALKAPLTEMPVAHEYGSATYYRGAFVLRMLENQIGTDNMYKGIRGLIADRRGKDTTWYDLRPYFEKAWGQKLDWFWSQWVSGTSFPTLAIVDAQGIPTASGTKVQITVRQSGTANPFRLRFKVFARGINKEVSDTVEMSSPEAVFELNLGDSKAYEAGIDTFGYVLTPKLKAVPVKR